MRVWLILILFCSLSVSADNKADSLRGLLSGLKQDTARVELLAKLGWHYRNSNYDSSIHYANLGLLLSTKTGYLKGQAKHLNILALASYNKGETDTAWKYVREGIRIAFLSKDRFITAACHNTLAFMHERIGQYDSAVSAYGVAIKLQEEGKDSASLASTWGNLGVCRYSMGNFTAAADCYFKALVYMENPRNAKSKGNTMMNIGLVYTQMNRYDEALEYLEKALREFRAGNNMKAQGNCLLNIGFLFTKQERHDDALPYYEEALKCYEATGNMQGISNALSNISNVMFNKKDFKGALKCNERVLEIAMNIGDKYQEAIVLLNTGAIFKELRNYTKAHASLDKGMALAEEIGAKEIIMEGYGIQAETWAAQGDYQKAFAFHEKFVTARDCVVSLQNREHVAEIQVKYETAKKEKDLLKKDAAILRTNAANKRAGYQRNIVMAGCLVVAVVAFLLFRSFNLRKRSHMEISRQKALLEERQREILDSIHYARRIQSALLPKEKYLEQCIMRLKNAK